MKIAVIGGGITGLTAAYELVKNGHEVTVFEKEPTLGGLAGGFKSKNWGWFLEKTYHHFFTNDDAMFALLEELGLHDKIILQRPITATLMPGNNNSAGKRKNFRRTTSELRVQENFFATSARKDHAWQDPAIYQLDSPMNLLTFPFLSPVDKVRTAALLAFLKLNPFWQPLENITAQEFFTTVGGSHAWNVMWEPLMLGKFGNLAPKVAASWLWARIKKRTPRLCYVNGGFQTLIDGLATAIIKQGGKIYTNTAISAIKKNRHSIFVIHKSEFDAVLLTVPTAIAAKLVRFPASYIQPLLKIPHLYAQTLILETKEPILTNTYWLNINDRSFPFLACVAHTNFMDKRHYAGHHLTYFGNYLPAGHPYLSMNKKQLLKVFLPFIRCLSTNSEFSILNSELFSAPFAQPVHELHYSKRAPAIQTPIAHVYVANLDSIYPWDRGTNYAVELGMKAAKEIIK